jgi:NADPH:quinone reductase
MPKIVRFHETGSADVLKLEELLLVPPAADEVQIDVRALGINRAEVAFRSGQYIVQPELPSRLGYEAAGIVSAVGAGVTDVRVGETVSVLPCFDIGRHGVYGESATVPRRAVVRHSDKLNFAQAAALWMQFLTSYGALLRDAGLSHGQTVVISAASSSVGVAAIQIAKRIGARVVATTRGADKRNFLFDVGADHVIVTDEEDIAERTMALTGGDGADLLFDPVAGPFLQKMADAARFGATIYVYGALFGETSFPLYTALSKSLRVHAYTVLELMKDPNAVAEAVRYITEGVDSGEFVPVIDREFALESIADAHRYMESNQQKGKIVVTV